MKAILPHNFIRYATSFSRESMIYGVAYWAKNVFSNHRNGKPNFYQDIIGEFNFDCSTLSGDHHNYFNDIAKTKNEDVLYVKNRCIKLHIASKDSTYYQPIIEQMKNWLAECN